jgi:hypothetical protein
MTRKPRRDPVSAEELDTLRDRLAEGFYERPDVEDAIARAVRVELNEPHSLDGCTERPPLRSG